MERSKSARPAPHSQPQQSSGQRRIPRSRSAGSVSGRRSVPDFYTSGFAGPTASLVAHMRMFSLRAEAMRLKSSDDRATIKEHNRRLHTPRNNPQPADAFVHWKRPRFTNENSVNDKMMSSDTRRSFQDEYRGSASPVDKTNHQITVSLSQPELVTNVAKIKLPAEAYAPTAIREMPRLSWQANEDDAYHQAYDGNDYYLMDTDYLMDKEKGWLSSEFGASDEFLDAIDQEQSTGAKIPSQKAVTFKGLNPSTTTAVQGWLEQADEKERDIALGFLNALAEDTKKKSKPSTARAIASIPVPQVKAKQPNFSLRGKAVKQKSITPSLGNKDTPILHSRQYIPELRRKELKSLMSSIEKEIDVKRHVERFVDCRPSQIRFKPRHQRSVTDPSVNPRSFFSHTNPVNRGYFIIAPDWTSERLVT
ncbi:uncharacterized protein LOC134192675 [Corticium candelabrum]|uniref:uncharacterized protein LOC134192675 n=1 Tax=Corticium candelabrum TaxID=121492 RepID=UPI002E265F6B|nr:uncharacterized protein LOC134192675 [Corticium candelabrum]